MCYNSNSFHLEAIYMRGCVIMSNMGLDYAAVRQTAIEKLIAAQCIGDGSKCEIDGTKVPTEEATKLMEQLGREETILRVPLALYMGSDFWRLLKALSNRRAIAFGV